MTRVFYGWWNLLASGLIFGTTASLTIFALGALYAPLEQEFGWSRGQVSTMLAVSFGVAAILSPLFGKLLDTFGAPRVIAVSSIILTAGMVLFAMVTEFWQLAVCLIIIAAGRLGTTNLVVNSMIVTWFKRQRGLAMGLTRIGLSIGTIVGVPATAAIVIGYGWRNALLVNATVILLISLPLALFVLKRHPKDMGLNPDGDPDPEPTLQFNLPPERPSLALQAAAKTPTFWAISLAMIFFFFAEASLALHAQPFLMSRGVEYQMAATVGGAIPAAYLLGGLLLGPIADRGSARIVLACSFFVMSASYVLLWIVAPTPFVWVFVPIFGICAGSILSIYATFIADLFGVASFGAILGVISMLSTVGVVVGPSLAGILFDVTGSYASPFIAYGIASIIGGIVILQARRPKVTLLEPVAEPALSR